MTTPPSTVCSVTLSALLLLSPLHPLFHCWSMTANGAMWNPLKTVQKCLLPFRTFGPPGSIQLSVPLRIQVLCWLCLLFFLNECRPLLSRLLFRWLWLQVLVPLPLLGVLHLPACCPVGGRGPVANHMAPVRALSGHGSRSRHPLPVKQSLSRAPSSGHFTSSTRSGSVL